jgi:GTP cyclohydrolase II
MSTTDPVVARYAEAEIPTEYGDFRVFVYRQTDTDAEHLAVVKGDVRGHEDVLARVHSECLTGEVLHSLKCDCREQLDLALRRIAEAGRGVVLYLRQEGRGIGLGNKIRAYALQEQGYDTVDANRALGFEDDLRTYDIAACMLADLGVRSIRLLTNNPAKVEQLRKEGVNVTSRVEHLAEPHAWNRGYLESKRARMGHLYDLARVGGHGDDTAPRREPTPLRKIAP